MNIFENVIVIDNIGSSSFQSYQNLGCTVIEPYERKQRKYFRIRYILHRLRLDNIYFFNSVFDLNSDFFKFTNPKIIIIRGSLIYEPLLNKLRHLYPRIPIIYLYSNIVKSSASISPTALKKYGIIGFSWDMDDCSEYGLMYNAPSFDPNLINPIQDNLILYDICFIGVDKGRYKLVKKIENLISNAGYRSYIHITPNYSFLKKTHNDYKEKIPYNQYLKITASSGCIIDLVQKGQTGTTMRTMEALFNGKKLISNNPRLKEFDFYNPDNIFIIEGENIKEIPEFLRTPYVKIGEDILKKYLLKDNLENLIHIICNKND